MPGAAASRTSSIADRRAFFSADLIVRIEIADHPPAEVDEETEPRRVGRPVERRRLLHRCRVSRGLRSAAPRSASQHAHLFGRALVDRIPNASMRSRTACARGWSGHRPRVSHLASSCRDRTSPCVLAPRPRCSSRGRRRRSGKRRPCRRSAGAGRRASPSSRSASWSCSASPARPRPTTCWTAPRCMAAATFFMWSATPTARVIELRRAEVGSIVAVDQEEVQCGGSPWAPPVASEPQQAARRGSRRQSMAAPAGRYAGRASPSSRTSTSRALRERRSRAAFSSDPAETSWRRRPSGGWRSGGTARQSCLAAGAGRNTDSALVTTRGDRSAPVRGRSPGGVPLVMVGHARYPALTANSRARNARSSSASSVTGRAAVSSSPTRWRRVRRSRPGASPSPGTRGARRRRHRAADRSRFVRTGLRTLARGRASRLAFRARVREAAACVLALVRRGAQPPR